MLYVIAAVVVIVAVELFCLLVMAERILVEVSAIGSRPVVPPRAEPRSAPVDNLSPLLWERLEKVDGQWVATGHVRYDTPAWNECIKRPGLALRSPGGTVMEGWQ